jgi:predicted membrane channel-forming protein YqfA (hemolysin III family)
MGNHKSSHILGASSTLFGLCYVIFSSLNALNLAKQTLIDEFTAVSMLLFLISCIFSFLAIRGITRSAERYEKIADYCFISGLVTLFITTVSLTFKLIV